ncbi:MAG: hypothetical protein HOP22_08685 [Nitrospiraceae bacterium]|nr:hypothetical protein [Nitrospiraceae bacterium]
MNMTLKRPFLLVLASLLILGSPLLALAETKVLTAEATYIMGDGETPSSAEAMVLQKAKQIALEQAGTYVESYTKIQNLDLTVEEIQTIAGGVLQVDVLEKKRSLVGDGLQLYIKIRAAVSTDKMQELAQRIRGKNAADEYKRLQEEYVRLSKEIETWKQLIIKTSQGAERNTALDQIREREKAFSSLQSRELAFYQQLFSGEGILAEATSQLSKKQAHKEILEGLVQWITTKGYRITHQKPSVRTSIKKPGYATVTIPVSIGLTTEARQRIVEVAEQLGGSMQTLRHPTPETMCGKDTFQKSSLIAFPVILSQDAELQELLLELVNNQVLEISARKADDTIIFENSQKLMSQRVSDRDCSANPGRDIAPLRRYYLQTAPTSSKPLVAPFFSYALPTLEELYPGFEDIISKGRTKNESDSDILKYINFEIEHIRQASPELSAEQLAEFSAGCRIFSDAYKAARDEERRLERAQIGAMIGMMGALMNRDSMASE